ncbi:hypothetical protein FLAG1_11688 [Fusarium langsethiae]|uniref:F-box domain-containing protein n=1 Tax=Fusarium langsethiae TaxID=179993 RepID=A0A0N0V4L9_FUSLA|nr:hypothetical protein FLAG1_11688 [Fusarium langsethiae]GKU23145.1 unnamed protein product [Fusarium langsethiae]
MEQLSLLDCPQEVQLQIAEFLAQNDLANLCMTSWHLHNLVQPLLYSTIQISWVQQYHPPIVQVFCFIRTLLEKPELCNHVRSLDFDGDSYVDYLDPPEPGETPGPPDLPVLPLDRIVKIIKRTGVSQTSADSWISKILYSERYSYLNVPEDNDLSIVNKVHKEWADGTMAFLLSLLPGLSRFSASINWCEETSTLRAVFPRSLRPTTGDPSHCSFPNLQSLEDVSVASTLGVYLNIDPENTEEALSMFYLPNIRTLSVSIDNPVRFTWPGPLPPNPAFLTSLEIHRLRECHLAPILSATKGLKWLRYNWFYRPDVDEDVSTDIVMLGTMAKAFLEVSETLEELQITAQVEPALSQGEYEPPEVTFQESLIQLSRMSRLKALQVPWSFLIGSGTLFTAKQIGPALPVTLHHLTLSCEFMEGRDEALVLALEREFESGALSNATSLKGIYLPPRSSYPSYRHQYAKLQSTGRHDYVAVDPGTGAIGVWLNGCGDPDTSKKKHRVVFTEAPDGHWVIKQRPVGADVFFEYCGFDNVYKGKQALLSKPDDAKFPFAFTSMKKLYDHSCFYLGGTYRVVSPRKSVLA